MDVYNKHMKMWHFTIIFVKENFVFNNMHKNN